MEKRKIDEDYLNGEAQKITDKELEEAMSKRDEIERKIAKSGILRKYAVISKHMFLMLNDYRRGMYKNVPRLTIATLVFMLLYVLNPLDLIPDFVPIFGYVDDLTIMALGLNFIQKDLRKYLDWKYNSEVESKEL